MRLTPRRSGGGGEIDCYEWWELAVIFFMIGIVNIISKLLSLAVLAGTRTWIAACSWANLLVTGDCHPLSAFPMKVRLSAAIETLLPARLSEAFTASSHPRVLGPL